VQVRVVQYGRVDAHQRRRDDPGPVGTLEALEMLVRDVVGPLSQMMKIRGLSRVRLRKPLGEAVEPALDGFDVRNIGLSARQPGRGLPLFDVAHESAILTGDGAVDQRDALAGGHATEYPLTFSLSIASGLLLP